jgi:hypothetical protein
LWWARRAVEACQTVAAASATVGENELPQYSAGGLTVNGLKEMLRALPDAVRYLRSRRSRPFGSITSEADLQDLMYLTIKPSVPDLEYEVPTEKNAAGYSIADFTIPSLKMMIEAKYIEARADVKRVAGEIAEDIWKYTQTGTLGHLVFLVYDPNLMIADRVKFVGASTAAAGTYAVRGRHVEIETIVVPA